MSELGFIDFITPDDAREAMLEVRKSAFSLNRDFVGSKKLPVDEAAAWRKWYADFNEYYDSLADSFAGWKFVDSSGVLQEAERLTSDLGAWRGRYQHITGDKPATPAPVRLNMGPSMGGLSLFLKAAAALGAVMLARNIYRDYFDK